MTNKEFIRILKQFPDDYDIQIWIQFCLDNGRKINMGEICDIESVFENGMSIDVEVHSTAWDSAFDQAMIKEKFLNDNNEVEK